MGKPMAFITDNADIAPDLAAYQDGIFYVGGVLGEHEEDTNSFDLYLEKAKDYYSVKKHCFTLRNRPHFTIFMYATT